MSDELVRKMIEALRDMAAKVDETTTYEVPDIDQGMRWQQHGQPFPTRSEERPKYERAWLSGRLLGMADAAEALVGSGRNLADATPNPLKSKEI